MQAAIKRMLIATGGIDGIQRSVNGILDRVRQTFADVTKQSGQSDDPIVIQLDSVFAEAKFLVNVDEIISRLVPVYSRYFTVDEINQIADFYSAPLGQKCRTHLMSVTNDAEYIGAIYVKELFYRAKEQVEREKGKPVC